MRLQDRIVICFIIVIILILPVKEVLAQTNDLARLRSLFSKEKIEIRSMEEPELGILSFDLGESATSTLEDVLMKSTDERKKYMAAHCLALIGGEKAVNSLKKAYKKDNTISLKHSLCFAMASTGSKEDVDFLIQSLHGEHYGNEWPPIQQAAYSLGILQSTAAINELKSSDQQKRGFASSAADDALNWINGNIWETAQPNNESDEIIFAMVRFGIPGMSESHIFYDKNSKRVWKREGKTWSYEIQQDITKNVSPSINFSIHITPDHARAICQVGLIFGSLNGSGYEFVLNKKNGIWKVVGIMQTWVS